MARPMAAARKQKMQCQDQQPRHADDPDVALPEYATWSKKTRGRSMPDFVFQGTATPQMSCTAERIISMTPEGGDDADDGGALGGKGDRKAPVQGRRR